jgi:hypothetical protein
MIPIPDPFLPNISACPHAIVNRMRPSRRNYNRYRANPGLTLRFHRLHLLATRASISVPAVIKYKTPSLVLPRKFGNYNRHRAKPGVTVWVFPAEDPSVLELTLRFHRPHLLATRVSISVPAVVILKRSSLVLPIGST